MHSVVRVATSYVAQNSTSEYEKTVCLYALAGVARALDIRGFETVLPACCLAGWTLVTKLQVPCAAQTQLSRTRLELMPIARTSNGTTAMPSKVLFILSSHDKLINGKPTGWYVGPGLRRG